MSKLLQQINITHTFKTQPPEQINITYIHLKRNHLTKYFFLNTITNSITLDYNTCYKENIFHLYVT